jgi:molybdenum cofactor biosynthesis protein B
VGVEEHRAAAARPVLRGAILTITDSRAPGDDASGDLIASLLAEAGHELAARAWLPNELGAVRERVAGLLREELHFVITTGGTGIGQRDVTIEAVTPLLEKRLDGFGELFRALSYAEVGSAALLSRAVAGTAGGRVICCLPGSIQAVRLAMTKLLLPELAHLVWQAGR